MAGLLAEMGYSLQATSKQVEGAQHPDRDSQFRSVNQQATAHLAAGQPVISVDTKKKEVVGNLANKGREWQPKGDPVRAVPLTRHDWHGEWNYTIAGATARPTAA